MLQQVTVRSDVSHVVDIWKRSLPLTSLDVKCSVCVSAPAGSPCIHLCVNPKSTVKFKGCTPKAITADNGEDLLFIIHHRCQWIADTLVSPLAQEGVWKSF